MLLVVAVANATALMAAAIWLRLVRLETLPGINGDEAWYGIQAVRLLRGEAIEWLTPTNNPLNVFYFTLVVAVHALLEPSPLALRLPAVLSGLLTLPLNYWLGRRFVDRGTALVSTLCLAVLPVTIAYSRLGWDAAQTPAAALLVVYFSLAAVKSQQPRKWIMAAAGACAVARLVHPANIFLMPLVAVAAAVLWRRELLKMLDPQGRPWRALCVYAVPILAAGIVFWKGQHWLQRVVLRLRQPEDILAFGGNFARLFNGVMAHEYMSGSKGTAAEVTWDLVGTWYDGLGLVLFAGALLLVGWYFLKAADRADWILLSGYGLGLIAFFLVGGPSAISPPFGRYGLFLVVPAVLFFARACSWWLIGSRWRGAIILACAGWLFVAGFQRHFVEYQLATGGRAHRAFRTADVEPKLQALQMLRQHSSNRLLLVVADDWWLERPLTYLALREPRLKVLKWHDAQAAAVEDSAAWRQAMQSGRVCFVQFEGSQGAAAAREFLLAVYGGYHQTVVRDHSGIPLLTVLLPESRSEANRKQQWRLPSVADAQ